MGNPHLALHRNTVRGHISALLCGINYGTMDYGDGLTELSSHLDAWPGLGFGNTYFSSRVITDSEGIHMLGSFCSCLGVMLAQGHFRAREVSGGPFPAQLSQSIICTQKFTGMWGNDALGWTSTGQSLQLP